MKLLTAVFFSCVVVAVASNSYSQQAKFSFNLKNVTLREVFDEIEKNSEFILMYSEADVDLERVVCVEVKNKNIQTILKQLFDGTSNAWKISDRQIVVNQGESKTVSQKELLSRDERLDDGNLLIRGRVFDKSEPPQSLPGVSVSIKNTTRGTVTDEQGYFKLTANKGDILVFSFIGYRPQEFLVEKSKLELIISLAENIQNLEEVIVTGLTEERRLNSISSISKLDISSHLENKPVTQLSQALQGGITGLTATQSSGIPGADAAEIKIRGISTLGNSDPLILVDGIPMDMNNLDPTTIESVTVLKDAAAAAIFGSRAANGVIVIKTKRGEPGNVKVRYNGYYGIQRATYAPKFVDGPTYMKIINEATINEGGDPRYSLEAIDLTKAGTDPINYPNTDWYNLLVHDGSVNSHSVSVSGGSSLARFSLNLNYLGQQGFLDNVDSERLTLRVNTTVTVAKNLNVNMDFNAYRTDRREPLDGANWFLNRIDATLPTMIPKYPDKGDGIDYYGKDYTSSIDTNPMLRMEKGGISNWLNDNISVNIQPKWTIKDKLNFRGQFSYRVNSSITNEKRDEFNYFDYETGQLLSTFKTVRGSSQGRSSYYFIGGNLDYTLEKDDHRLFTIAGYNQELTNSGAWDEWSMISTFGKLNYSFKDKYLLEGTLRVDGSSRFGKGNKFGFFPSVGIGWVINKESFLQDYNWLDIFKLRASYGQLGNENIGLYRYQSVINSKTGVESVFGNANITWETVTMLDSGFELAIFNGFAEITFDWYDKLTTDIIISPPVPLSAGIKSSPINAGEVRNRGWEFSVNLGKQKKDFNYNVHLGLSFNKNKIERLINGPYDNNSSINKEGYAINSYYRYKTAGLLQESDFIGQDENGSWIPKEGIVIFDGQAPGDIKYLDTSKDGALSVDDRTIQGKRFPSY
ncbi:MAG: SusC/RagA family TonB-linked outer membrane protein, partial [Mangrovibacterium sp.]|nr:SusC/RagA family TonB-linked outer membrane protein [Mangrovibacterium sp.]